MRYLTGFSGSNGGLLLRKDLSALMATDGRYTTQIAEEVPDIEASLGRDVGPHLLGQVSEDLRVGYEADYVTVSQLERRTTARAEQDWATADAVRDRLAAAGISITDTADGPTWSLAD